MVTSVRGSVVDVRFDGRLPAIRNLLRAGADGAMAIEVLTQVDARHVRGIALTPTQGLARGMALCMTGDKLSATDAKAMGMIWEVADDAVAAAKALAEKLAEMEKRRGESRKARAKTGMPVVSLVGYTNVGKSTLMNLISKSEVFAENKLFATLDTTVRKVVFDNLPFLLSDTVGFIRKLPTELIESFKSTLDEVREADLLLHVVDVSGCEGRDPKADFEQINHELAGFSAELADRPQIVLGNKCDIATSEQVEEFKNYIEAKGLTFLPISAATRQGVDNLPALVYSRLKDLPPVKVYEAEYKRPDKSAMPTRPFTVTRTGDHEFTVDAPWLERILAGTNVEDYESLQYFQTQLGDSGILDELVRQNVEEDDTIKIGEYEFDYVY